MFSSGSIKLRQSLPGPCGEGVGLPCPQLAPESESRLSQEAQTCCRKGAFYEEERWGSKMGRILPLLILILVMVAIRASGVPAIWELVFWHWYYSVHRDFNIHYFSVDLATFHWRGRLSCLQRYQAQLGVQGHLPPSLCIDSIEAPLAFSQSSGRLARRSRRS